MRQPRSRPTNTAPAQRAVSAEENRCECRCDRLPHGGTCPSSPLSQMGLTSQKRQREWEEASPPAPQQRWHSMHSGILFALACLTSPCCTPLIVPLGLSLLAGTPAALWLTQHGGWVYGVLTGISLLSAVLGLYGMRTPARPRRPGARPSRSTKTPESSLRPSDQEALEAPSET